MILYLSKSFYQPTYADKFVATKQHFHGENRKARTSVGKRKDFSQKKGERIKRRGEQVGGSWDTKKHREQGREFRGDEKNVDKAQGRRRRKDGTAGGERLWWDARRDEKEQT